MLLANVNIVDVLNGEVIRDSSVRVDKAGIISHIGKVSTLKTVVNEEVIDLGGRYLFPGLISCHTHLAVVYPFSKTDPKENPDSTAFRAALRTRDDLI